MSAAAERVRAVAIRCSLTGSETGEYRMFLGDKCLGDVSTKALADRLTLPAEPTSEQLEEGARKAAMFLFDTYGDAEGVVWAGLTDTQRDEAKKAASAIYLAMTKGGGNVG